MRRAIVLFGALILMLSLHALRTEAAIGATDPMFLAAIGFVVLAAFTVGEMGRAARLPAITGYIIAGILLGPQFSQIAFGPGANSVLSADVVEGMSVFNTLALGLIAITAGLELELGAIRKVARTLTATVIAKVPLLLVLVGGGVFLVEDQLSTLGLASRELVISFALILAVLGIGTSPAIALAIVSESKAKGRLSDLTMAIAVVKDLVVVVALAIAIALVKIMIEPNSAGLGPAMVHVGRELGGSILLGIAVGGALIAYLRFVDKELLLTALLTVVVIAEVTRLLHLELLLVFIAAGFVVRNFSDFEHELLDPLERISLPVFVVFFTTAGAKVDLQATLAVLPLAAGIAVLRAVAFALAAEFGGRFGREQPAVRKNAWLAYTPQAGVTLGLVMLAANALPALAEPIRQTGMAVVTINLLIGPILVGLALRRAGEVPQAVSESSASPPPPTIPHAVSSLEPAEPPPVAKAALDPALATEVERFDGALLGWTETFVEEVLEPLIDRGRSKVVHLFVDHHRHEDPTAAIRQALEAEPPDPAEALEDQIDAHHLRFRVLADAMASEVVVPMTPADLATGAGPLATRIARMFARAGAFARRSTGHRRVPVRRIARYAGEGESAETLASVFARWFRVERELIEDVGRIVAGTATPDEARAAIEDRLDELRTNVVRDLRHCVESLSGRMATLLASTGTPGNSASAIRLHRVEGEGERALKRVRDDGPKLRRRVRAELDTLRARALLVQLDATIAEAHTLHIEKPLLILVQDLLPIVADVKVKIAEGTEDALGDRVRARVRGLQIKFRYATQATHVLTLLSKSVEQVPGVLSIVVAERRDGTIVDLAFARDIEEQLVERFATELTEVTHDLTELVAAIDARLDQAVSVAAFGGGAEDEDAEAMADARERACSLVTRLEESIEKAVELCRVRAEEIVGSARKRMSILRVQKQSAAERVAGTTRGTGRLVLQRAVPYVERGRRILLRSFVRLSALRKRQDVQDWIRGGIQIRLDPVGTREYLDRALGLHSGIPDVYVKAFSGEPLEDPRLAVAHRLSLEDLISAVQPGKSEDFANVMIIGDRGSGRTTMMNLLTHRLVRHRVVRLDARYHARASGVIGALGAELGVAPTRIAIEGALRRSTTVILIDDLERFVLPTVDGIEALGAFLSLVVNTGGFTHWVVSVQRRNFSLLSSMVPLREAFGRWLELKPLDAPQIEAVIDERIRISGLSISYARRSRWARRIRVGDEKRAYFRALARLSNGCLRTAMMLHLRSVASADDEGIEVRPPRSVNLPFIEQLGPQRVAALVLFLRYGEMSDGELAQGINIGRTAVRSHVLPLVTAGLLTRSAAGTLDVPPRLVPLLQEVMANQGLVEDAS